MRQGGMGECSLQQGEECGGFEHVCVRFECVSE